MSAKVIVTGNVGGDPRYGTTRNGKPYLGFSVGATHARFDKDANRWEDVGEPVWYKVTLWDRDADRFRDVISKGVRVSVEGVQVKRSWTTDAGETRVDDEVGNAKLLGVIPRMVREPSSSAASFNQAPAGGSVGDAWGAGQQAEAGSDYGQPPF